MDTFFKGWAKPGIIPPGALTDTIAPDVDESLDALCGHFKIFQLKSGHRFSTDDVLTAWYGTLCCPSAGKVLDLGSGIGSVGMLAAWRLQGAKFVTIEAQDESIKLAKKSCGYNGLSTRYEIRHGDFRDKDLLGEDERFDLILGSPPYFPLGSGILGNHPQKVACRFEVRGCIADYCAVASRHLSLGGVFSCVFPVDPSQQLDRIMNGAKEAGLSIVRRRSVVLREGDSPLIGVFTMMRTEHIPENLGTSTWIEPDLMIRDKTGKATHEYVLLKLSMGMPPTN